MTANSLFAPLTLLAAFGLLYSAIGGAEPPDQSKPSPYEDVRIARLIGKLGSEEFQEREQAAKDLITIGDPALEHLRKALRSSDLEVVRRAQECIPLIERNVKIAACTRELTESKDPKTRVAATGYLAELGPAAESAVPALISALTDGEWRVRERAAITLGLIGPKAKAAGLRLSHIVANSQEIDDVRLSAAKSLGQIGAGAHEAVPTLVRVLEANGGSSLKSVTATALGSIASSHEQVLPSLFKALKDHDPYVRSAAGTAIGMIAKDHNASVAALLAALKKPRPAASDYDPRRSFLAALGKFGRNAQRAVPAIVDVVKNDKEHRFIRTDGIEALEEIGPAAREAVPALRVLAEQKRDIVMARRALRALEVIIGPLE